MRRRVIAHRGHTVGAPEQTLLAYRLAIELGAEMIEADLRFSRDGVGVMLHDARLDRTTDGHGLVSDMDWADIARLDAGSWFSRETARQRVPRLEDLFDLAQAAGTALCIEAVSLSTETVCVVLELTVTQRPVMPCVTASRVLLALERTGPPLTVKRAFWPRVSTPLPAVRPSACRRPPAGSVRPMPVSPVVLLARFTRSVAES